MAASLVLVTGAVLATAAPWAGAATRPVPAASLSGGEIAAAPRVPLPQPAPSVPPGAQVLGPLPAGTTVSVDVALSVPDASALSAFVAGVSTPSSPQHGQYLTPDQFATRFSPSPAAVDAVDRWLAAEGLSAGPAPTDRLYVPVSGTVTAMGRAFGTSFSAVRLPSGRQGYLPTSAPTVPKPLAPTVQAVVGLGSVHRWHPLLRMPGAGAGAPIGATSAAAGTAATSNVATTNVATTNVATTADSAPQSCPAGRGVGGVRSYTRLASVYDMSGLYGEGRSGAGVTVAVLELEGYTSAELATFDACYGIAPTVHDIPVDGGPTAPTPGSGPPAGLESSLDIETVAALAPSATINVFQGPSSGLGAYDTLHAIANTPSATVVSTSWGQCEAAARQTMTSPPAAEATLFEQMAAEGKTVLAAAGDSGSAGCWYSGTQRSTTPIHPTTRQLAVDDPASQPTVTGVGGTALGSTTSPVTQRAWSTSGGAGGGGASSIWSLPAYQSADAVKAPTYPVAQTCPTRSPAPSTQPGCRAVPDVSADAATSTGYAVYFDGRWEYGVGGTSAAAPLWAALVALADQGCATPLGEANPTLYRPSTAAAGAFTDVTTGNNDLNGYNPSKYPAGPGYDLATGLGTPDGAKLVAAVQPAGGCPTVTGLSGHEGPATGGTTVTVAGTDLAGATSVHFGDAVAAIQSSSATSVTVAAPASTSLQTVDVTVTTPAGTSAAVPADRYTYGRSGKGYREVAADGGVFSFGDAPFYGSMGGKPLDQPIVGTAATPDGKGYWEVASDGGVFSFGDASFYGSMGGTPLDQPIVGMAATPDGQGYWEVASDGGVFAFGDAAFYGSMGGHPLNAPVVGLTAAENGHGYWEVAADGGIFAFGDASFYGSMGGHPLNQPIVALASTPAAGGYWEVAADGGVFSFGDAAFYGSMGGKPLDRPIVAVTATPGGRGYWEVAADGGIFAFGDAAFYGSMGGKPLDRPIVGLAAT